MNAALNDLEVGSTDRQNAYHSASVRGRVSIVAGPEFGPKQDKYARKSIYNLGWNRIQHLEQ
jgi:hypothetical protein